MHVLFCSLVDPVILRVVLFTCLAEEVRHASRNADSACPFLPSRQYKKEHAESAFRDACRTSSACLEVQN